MDHPSVEVVLPVDGDQHSRIVPRDTTHFYFRALAAGSKEEPPAPRDTNQGRKQFQALSDARDQISWELNIEGESVPVLSELLRYNDKKGFVWWRPFDVSSLPATATVRFSTEGSPPLVDGDEIALWPRDGERISWGTTTQSQITLQPPTDEEFDFPMRTDRVWNEHPVHIPRHGLGQNDT